jgi:monovalent cation:proton antiporter-2 (CPA2) family protein
MHSQGFFFQALIYLSAAVISVPLAKRLGLGSVLGYLLAGIIIGPYILGLVGEEGTDVMHFAEFGVVLMLFLIGLELRPALLWQMRKSIFGLGGLQVIITAIAIAGIAMFFNLTLQQSITIGLIFALSSTAIVLQTLSEKGILKTRSGQSSFSVLLFQDIAIIPILALLPLMANQIEITHLAVPSDHSQTVNWVSNLPGWGQVLIIFSVVAFIIFGGRILGRHLFRFIANTGLREIFTAAALLMVVAIALLMDRVGLSPALGTFLAGVVLADNEYRHELESNIEPFKGLLLGLFFISVGSSIDFNILFQNPLLIFSLLVGLIMVKFFVLYFLGKVFGLKSGQEFLFAFALAQGGEFAFVIISFAGQNAILNDQVSGTILIVVALSMLITPLLLIFNEKVIQHIFVTKQSVPDSHDVIESDNDILIAGFGRFGLVLGRFLKANGITATILDNNPTNIQVLRKFGHKVFYGDATRMDLLEIAGAAKAKVLVIAIDDREQITHMVERVRKEFPNLEIISRAVDVRHYFELSDLGVKKFRRETYDSSIDLGIKTLYSLGFNKYQAHRAARTFRYHDNLVMNELQKLWKEDKKDYISEARKFSEQLEEMLLAELHTPIHDSDNAWDISSRIEEIKEMVEESLSRKD